MAADKSKKKDIDVISTEHEAWNLFKRAGDYMENVLLPIAKKYGLTIMQLRAVCVVYKAGSVTVGSLAKAAGIIGTNASTMCRKLTELGFLHRKKNSRDERVVNLALTDKGIETAKEAEQLLTEQYNAESPEELLAELEKAMQSMHRLSRILGLDD